MANVNVAQDARAQSQSTLVPQVNIGPTTITVSITTGSVSAGQFIPTPTVLFWTLTAVNLTATVVTSQT